MRCTNNLGDRQGVGLYFYTWLLGLFFVLLIILFSGFKTIFILIIALLLTGICWVIFCFKKPLVGFLLLLFEFILVYSRFQFGSFEVGGPGNRGALTVGDFLWLGFFISLIFFYSKKKIYFRYSFPHYFWMMIPFNVAAVLLPILGIMTGNWPLSYAVPALRHLQWMSFGLAAYLLALEYGTERFLHGVLKIIISAGFIHFIYGLVQLRFSLGLLNRSWVYLDDLFVQQHQSSWFNYPRLTGLLTNPNSYGLFCAVLFTTSVVVFTYKPISNWRLYFWPAFTAASFGLIFSGSRSALLGLGTAIIFIGLNYLFNKRIPLRLLELSSVFLLGGAVFPIFAPLIPVTLQGRFERFLAVFSTGVGADINALSRVEEWKRLWKLYLTEYPFGTWVPPSYAVGSAVDSFYIQTTMQGTPIYMLLWILFMSMVIFLGWKAYQEGDLILSNCSLLLIGWTGILLGGSVTVTVMLDPTLITIFWTMVGVVWAGVWYPTGRRKTGVVK